MNPVIGESKIVKFFKTFYVGYENSVLHSFFASISSSYKSSSTNKILTNYFTKNPTFEYSKSYRAIRFVASKLDSLMKKFHRSLVSKLKSSNSYELQDYFKKEVSINYKFPLYAFIIPFIIGYSLFVTINNTWGKQSLLITSILILLVAFTFLTENSIIEWYKNSVLCKFIKYIWD